MDRRSFLKNTVKVAAAAAIVPSALLSTPMPAALPMANDGMLSFTIPEMTKDNLHLAFPSKATLYWQNVDEDGNLGEARVIGTSAGIEWEALPEYGSGSVVLKDEANPSPLGHAQINFRNEPISFSFKQEHIGELAKLYFDPEGFHA